MHIGSNFLTKLTLRGVPLHCLHDRNYQNLVELSYSPIDRHDEALYSRTLNLQRLRRLCIFRYWQLVATICAPNIEVIELRDGYSWTYPRAVYELSVKDLPFQILYLHLNQDADQATFINVLNTLSIPTLVDLRLEQEQKPSIDVMKEMLEYVQNGLDLRWNRAIVSGEPEQLAAWVETGLLVPEQQTLT
jgi:hypothetical protein